jgi:diguanylate cyclase (GGDEF)-like protein
MGQAHARGASFDNDLGDLAAAIGHIGGYVDTLRQRTRLLEAVIDNFPGGISVFDKDLRLVLCNEKQKAMLGYPESLLESQPTIEEILRFNAARGEYGPGDPEQLIIAQIGRQREPCVYERTRSDGTILEVHGAPIEGGGFVTFHLDVTEQRRNQAMIAHLALHDGLTDLPNRALFLDRLHTAIALAKRSGLMAVHYLDIDNFKPVNDTLGHKAGDQLLVAIARRLRESVRENDTVARLGGDEFAIAQTGIREVADAAVLARRIISRLAMPFDIGGTIVRVGVSIGIAIAPRDGMNTDEVLVKADQALYKAKSSGRGRFSFYESEGLKEGR